MIEKPNKKQLENAEALQKMARKLQQQGVEALKEMEIKKFTAQIFKVIDF